MPELPDVEGYRRVLTAHLVGEVVREVEVLDDSVIRNSTRQCLEEAGKAYEMFQRKRDHAIKGAFHLQDDGRPADG